MVRVQLRSAYFHPHRLWLAPLTTRLSREFVESLNGKVQRAGEFKQRISGLMSFDRQLQDFQRFESLGFVPQPNLPDFFSYYSGPFGLLWCVNRNKSSEQPHGVGPNSFLNDGSTVEQPD